MKLSLILMVWNTSHLMARTLHTLQGQTITDEWELLIVDDMSMDDVRETIAEHGDGLPVKYHRLEHDHGMRGNTASINFGIERARGEIVMWSTPEVMLPPDALRRVCEVHDGRSGEKLFVTIPSHGLTANVQLRIDTVDWHSDVHSIKSLLDGVSFDHWDSVWFHLNFYEHGRPDTGKQKREYGNNQTVAVNRHVWLSTIGSFPLFLDYGSDDPWLLDERRRHGFRDVTLWDQEAYHQWHAHSQYWMAQGFAPNWNMRGHTIKNVANDPRVPQGGTCTIWDGGNRSKLTEEEAQRALGIHDAVVATGFKFRY